MKSALFLAGTRSAWGRSTSVRPTRPGNWLICFLNERIPTSLGKPLATLPRFQAAVGEIDAALSSAGELVTSLAGRADRGDVTALKNAGIAKLAATCAAVGSTELAASLIGNNALTRRNPLECHYRDVLCACVHAPQDDSILAAADRTALDRISLSPASDRPVLILGRHLAAYQ